MNVRSRQDALVRYLRRNGHVSIEELASATGVSRRTVIRDIATLRDQGFIIDSGPGKGGGVYLDPSSVQLTPKLSVDEVLALLISVAVMRATQTLPFVDFADEGLAKIESALPPDRIRDLREILRRLYIGPAASPETRRSVSGVNTDLLSVFERGFINLLRMKFNYVDRFGNRSAREIEPQALLVRPPVWYVVGFDPLKGDFRNFRMDRINNPALVDGSKFRRKTVHFEGGICLVPQLETAKYAWPAFA